jgi:hypothetical protein
MSESDIREHFEANMLDGNDLYNCGKAMISAETVYEYIKKYYILAEEK